MATTAGKLYYVCHVDYKGGHILTTLIIWSRKQRMWNFMKIWSDRVRARLVGWDASIEILLDKIYAFPGLLGTDPIQSNDPRLHLAAGRTRKYSG